MVSLVGITPVLDFTVFCFRHNNTLFRFPDGKGKGNLFFNSVPIMKYIHSLQMVFFLEKRYPVREN